MPASPLAQLPLTRGGHALVWSSLAIAAALFFTRHHPERLPAPLRGLEQHISNASLSYIVVLVLCVVALGQPRFWRTAVVATIGFLVANIVVESVVTVLNTPDLRDLLAGCIATLLAFTMAALVRLRFTT